MITFYHSYSKNKVYLQDIIKSAFFLFVLKGFCDMIRENFKLVPKGD